MRQWSGSFRSFLYLFKRILQSTSSELSAVFDAQTTLGTSIDYAASVLTRFFEAQSQTLHLEVGYTPFRSLSSSSCLKWDPAFPKSWLKDNDFDYFVALNLHFNEFAIAYKSVNPGCSGDLYALVSSRDLCLLEISSSWGVGLWSE